MAILKRILKKLFPRQLFPGSADYWEERYKEGGNSGSGSYNRLAKFKADFLNKFVKEKGVNLVMEFGVGDGNQLSLADYPNFIGLDVSKTILQMNMKKFRGDSTKSFFLYDSLSFQDNHKVFQADLTLSLDVLYHLIEDEIYEAYLRHLFSASTKYVIIYSSNFEKKQTYHVIDRVFTNWVEKNIKGWKMIEKVENPYKGKDEGDPDAPTSKADFFVYEKV